MLLPPSSTHPPSHLPLSTSPRVSPGTSPVSSQAPVSTHYLLSSANCLKITAGGCCSTAGIFHGVSTARPGHRAALGKTLIILSSIPSTVEMEPLRPSSSQVPHRGAELWLSTRRKLPDLSVPLWGAFWGALLLPSWGASTPPHCAGAGRVSLAVLFLAGPESRQNKSSFLAKRRAGERQPLQMRAGLSSGLPNSTFGCLNLALDGNFADVSPSGQPAARPAPTGAFATGCAQRAPFLPGADPWPPTRNHPDALGGAAMAAQGSPFWDNLGFFWPP